MPWPALVVVAMLTTFVAPPWLKLLSAGESRRER
jgi:hypothetical protein